MRLQCLIRIFITYGRKIPIQPTKVIKPNHVTNLTLTRQENQQRNLTQSLQHLPIYCLNAHILTDETDPSEITATLCQLLWDQACPDDPYPENITTPSQLRPHLKQLHQNHPKLAILITHCPPHNALITLCRKLTNVVAIAFLTNQPLEAPLKSFPPNQPNLITTIQTWLEEL